MADVLRKEPGLEVELVNGNPGELTILVDGRVVAGKKDNDFPSVEEVAAAVRKVEQPTAGART